MQYKGIIYFYETKLRGMFGKKYKGGGINNFNLKINFLNNNNNIIIFLSIITV